MSKTPYVFAFLIGMTLNSNAQEYKILELRNCQHETRTVTFQSQVRFFWKMVFGMSDINKQNILHFSPKYKADVPYLKKQIEAVRKAIPADFFSDQPSEAWYDNDPDESAIWFTVVFAKQDKQGNISAFAAYRVSFEGNNARLNEQRMNPQITN